jgi:hypothetical protein
MPSRKHRKRKAPPFARNDRVRVTARVCAVDDLRDCFVQAAKAGDLGTVVHVSERPALCVQVWFDGADLPVEVNPKHLTHATATV